MFGETALPGLLAKNFGKLKSMCIIPYNYYTCLTQSIDSLMHGRAISCLMAIAVVENPTAQKAL